MRETNDIAGLSLIALNVSEAIAIASDPDALERAYQNVFGTIEGKAVLFDIMREAALVQQRAPDMSALERAHRDGMVAQASSILDQAGVSSLERVAGLSLVAHVNSMERAHGNPDTSPDPGPEPGAGPATSADADPFADPGDTDV